MYDAPDAPWNTLHHPIQYDDSLPDTSRPKTPLPDATRTLRRTISYASIDTILPPDGKGVRRRITEMADSLKTKSTKKRKQGSSTRDVPQHPTGDLESDSKTLSGSKVVRRRRKTTAPLRDSSHRSEEESVVVVTDRLHTGVPSEQGTPLTFLDCEPSPLFVELLPKDDENPSEGGIFPPKCTLQPSRISRVDIKDVRLEIQASVPDVTIWDGLRAVHHSFRCRIFLRCTTHPYDSVSIPDIRRFETDCFTHPPKSRYFTKRPVLQTSYTGTAPCWISGGPNVDLAAGIHIDRFWRTILNADGTWGWYRDAFIPLSPRLFDKMEYREFKLVSRLWVGESCMEGELTFGISMLLREVDMR